MQVHKIQLSEGARCDKHDLDDNNFDEMVGSRERFSNDEKEKLISLRKPS